MKLTYALLGIIITVIVVACIFIWTLNNSDNDIPNKTKVITDNVNNGSSNVTPAPAVKQPEATTKIDFNEKIPLFRYLREIGKIYGCYFTLEEAYRKDIDRNKLENTKLKRSGKDHTLDEILRYIEKEIQTIAIIPNAKDARVYHVIDKRLLNDKDYILNVQFEKYDFTGELRELGPNISNGKIRVGAIYSTTTFDFPNVKQDNLEIYTLSVSVKASQSAVREILTNFMPLDKFDEIIWIIYANINNNKMTIYYY